MFQKIKRVLKLAYYWKKYHKLGVRWSDGVELGGFSTTFDSQAASVQLYGSLL